MARTFIDGRLDQILIETDDPIVVIARVSTLLVDFYKRDTQLLSIYLFSRRYYTFLSEEQLLKGAKFRLRLADIIRKGQKGGKSRNDTSPEARASAVWGAMQGMVRDRFYHERGLGFPHFPAEEMSIVVKSFIV